MYFWARGPKGRGSEGACTPLFVTAAFLLHDGCTQFNCPVTDEWIERKEMLFASHACNLGACVWVLVDGDWVQGHSALHSEF